MEVNCQGTGVAPTLPPESKVDQCRPHTQRQKTKQPAAHHQHCKLGGGGARHEQPQHLFALLPK